MRRETPQPGAPTILYQDNHLLVVQKPPGILSQAAAAGQPNLLDQLKNYRQQMEGKPGRAFLGLVHRLDREVGGVMVFAKTSKGAARLTEQFRERRVVKRYLAVLEVARKGMDFAPVEWRDGLMKDEPAHRVIVRPVGTAGTQLAITRCEFLEAALPLVLARFEPQTGRKHQLRAQAAARGMPILGDRRYGAGRPFAGIALWAHSLTIEHPTRREALTFVAAVPAAWKQLPFKNWP